jgi:hypothetical protein
MFFVKDDSKKSKASKAWKKYLGNSGLEKLQVL